MKRGLPAPNLGLRHTSLFAFTAATKWAVPTPITILHSQCCALIPSGPAISAPPRRHSKRPSLPDDCAARTPSPPANPQSPSQPPPKKRLPRRDFLETNFRERRLLLRGGCRFHPLLSGWGLVSKRGRMLSCPFCNSMGSHGLRPPIKPARSPCDRCVSRTAPLPAHSKPASSGHPIRVSSQPAPPRSPGE